MLHLGRWVFCGALAVMAVTLLTTLGRLPPVVATHFDGQGVPNAWSSRTSYTVLLLAIGGLLPLLIVGLVHWLSGQGPGMLNIPTRSFWLRAEHQMEAVRRVRAYMWWLASVMAVAAVAIHWLIVQAHRQSPPRLPTIGILSVLAGVLLAIAIWIAGWYRVLQPPPAAT